MRPPEHCPTSAITSINSQCFGHFSSYQRHICCHEGNIFSQEISGNFVRIMTGLFPHVATTGRLRIQRVCLTGLPEVQTCLLLKMNNPLL